ncbi:hypothetical protein MMC07_009254 [Pseudocyphellaria aurata]|nr:hypothetical protein [Pseudocyphellaria aurata]
MRLRILALIFWLDSLVTAVVDDDSSIYGISSNYPIDDGEQVFRSGDGGAPCAPDVYQNSAKLKARMVPCEKPKTPKTPTTSNDGSEGTPNNDDGTGNGELFWKHPRKFEWIPLPSLLLPPGSDGSGCPPDKFGRAQDLICYEGPEDAIGPNGVMIPTAIQCDQSFDCEGTLWCCPLFIPLIRWARVTGGFIYRVGVAYNCNLVRPRGPDTPPPGLPGGVPGLGF